MLSCELPESVGLGPFTTAAKPENADDRRVGSSALSLMPRVLSVPRSTPTDHVGHERAHVALDIPSE